MKFLGMILIAWTLSVQAQNPEPLKDNITFLSTSCQNILVDMKEGKLDSFKSDEITVSCAKRNEVYNFLCIYRDGKGKKFDEAKMVGGMFNSDGSLVGERGPVDGFIFNAISRKFYYEASSGLENGSQRMKKVCAGDWFYDKELKEYLKKKK